MTSTIQTPSIRRLTLCPQCLRETLHHGIFLSVWDDGSLRRDFAGWQCEDCGSEHSGS